MSFLSSLAQEESRQFNDRLNKARKAVAALDGIDGCKDRELKTILMALVCGLNHPETNAQFEALVMLDDRLSLEASGEARDTPTPVDLSDKDALADKLVEMFDAVEDDR